jgi:sulfate transport system ATP-binding protein
MVLLLYEPFGALDAQVRKDLRRWLRKLHDEIHVTSLFVTHDQEEALEVSDQVVIFSPGKVEQVGTPEEVYNHPANPFVLKFLGHVNIFHGRMQASSDGETERSNPVKSYVRPHEIELMRVGDADAAQGTVARVQWVHRAGSTVKVELEVEGTGQLVVAEVNREKWASLEFQRGDRVLVVARDSRVFSGDWEI